MATQSRERAASGRAEPRHARGHRGHDPLGGARDRGGGRAHRPLADDPRPARLPRRAVRRRGPQAHRPLLLGHRRARVRALRATTCSPATSSSATTPTIRRAGSGTCPTSARPSRSSPSGRVIAFAQVFGHHDDVGGMVPGSLPVHATEHLPGGAARARRSSSTTRGEPNEAALAIIEPQLAAPRPPAGRHRRRDRRLPGRLAPHRRARRALRGRRRGGGVRRSLIANARAVVREELLPKIADGVYHWEDYIENDGVDEPRLHALRLTMTKTAGEDRPRLQRHRPAGARARSTGPRTSTRGAICARMDRRRSCATLPTRPSARRRSTSTRASATSSTSSSRPRAR